MKQRIKRLLRATAPSVFDWIQAYRFRRHCTKTFSSFQTEIASAIYKDGDIRVLSGPFRGMAYFNEIVWGPITPKWIGSYEHVLHDVFVKEIIPGSYSKVVDVGAAEGYYAVGLARSLPDSTIFAFDIDPFARRLQQRLLQLNEVSNLRIGRLCTHQELDRILAQGGLVISDIEGYELELLDPDLAPSLLKSDILVELHEFDGLSVGDVGEAIRRRFEKSHDVRSFKHCLPEPSTYTPLLENHLDEAAIRLAIDEHRTSQQEWLWLKAR